MTALGLLPSQVQDRCVAEDGAVEGGAPLAVAGLRRTRRWGVLFASAWLVFFTPTVQDAWRLGNRE